MKAETIDDLLTAARQAQKAAYAPYSNYPVGAAVLARDGRIFTGCNVENISYPAGLCAERTALGSAVTAGAREFVAMAIVGGKTAITPCGICRQVMMEFRVPLVICGRGDNTYDIYNIEELLPHAFHDEVLQQ